MQDVTRARAAAIALNFEGRLKDAVKRAIGAIKNGDEIAKPLTAFCKGQWVLFCIEPKLTGGKTLPKWGGGVITGR